LTKGRIVAAHGRYSLHFIMGHSLPPQNCPFPWLSGHQRMVAWTNPSPQPKGHLDCFSRFCRAHDCDRPTGRHIMHAILRL